MRLYSSGLGVSRLILLEWSIEKVQRGSAATNDYSAAVDWLSSSKAIR